MTAPATVSDASPIRVEDLLPIVSKRKSETGDWLDPDSPYKGEFRFPKKFDVGDLGGTAKRHFEEYLSASTVVHLADAWGYFGRALGALSHGSLPLAQHLLYYSELRSALSLLARNGIHCIDRTNFVQTVGGELKMLGPEGTHVAVWKYLLEWGSEPAAVAAIGDSLRLSNSRLASWLDPQYGFASAQVVLPTLLEAWGADLRLYSRDQKWRNYNSYAPQHLQAEVERHSPSWLSRQLEEVWGLLRSDGVRDFAELDGWLFSSALYQAFARDREYVPAASYRRAITKALDALVDEPVRDRAKTVLLQDRSTQPEILRFAGLRASTQLPRSVAVSGMIGRALVLARLATANVHSAMRGAGVAGDRFERWAVDCFIRAGIPYPEDSVDGLLDTRADVEVALELLRSPTPGDDIRALSSVGHEWISSFQNLTKLERVLVWSLVA